jgi:hypothetical protein
VFESAKPHSQPRGKGVQLQGMRLSRLARSLPVTALALAAICNGCGLPQVQPRMAPDFAGGQTRVRTVAVLPVDLTVQIGNQGPRSVETVQLERATLDAVHRGLGAALARRGYQVTAVVEPNGASADPRTPGWRTLIHPKDLAALRIDIHQVTAPFAGPGLIETRVSADLTRYLGQNTGADASLYVRGWAYVAPSNAGRIALQVVLGVLIVLVVLGILVILLGSKGKSSGPRLGKIFSSPARVAAFGVAATGRAALRVGPYIAVAAAVHHHERVHCYTCPPPPPPEPYEYIDIQPPPPPPPPFAEPPPPVLTVRAGPPPSDHEVGLAVSLVHNQTGRVLWHAGQRFPVKVKGGTDLDALVEHFLKSLPPAR